MILEGYPNFSQNFVLHILRISYIYVKQRADLFQDMSICKIRKENVISKTTRGALIKAMFSKEDLIKSNS